jgi:hypothetical protein
MEFEGQSQLEPSKEYKKPISETTKIEQPILESKREISPEKQRKSEETVLDSLDSPIDKKDGLNDFDSKLEKATKSLSKYQEIEKKLAGVDKKNLTYELFKILKKDSDDKQADANAPKDGVLIKSIKKGPLECAGRTLIASTFLQEHGMDHVVVSAPGHAFLIIEQSQDTLVYFDANNNLFFTFPKTALEGYKGTKTSAECQLKEYTPRDSDYSDGINTAFSGFVSMPPKEAVGRQYLGNIAAALNGNKEFETSGIAVDKDASEATQKIDEKIYGKNRVLEKFYSRVDTLIKKEDMQTKEDRETIMEIFEKHPERSDFIDCLTVVLSGNVGKRIPYIKNASDEKRKEYAEKVWSYLQKPRL